MTQAVYLQWKVASPKKNPNTGEFDRHWDTIQGVRLGMNDVLLQTKEDWTYPVQTSKVVALIETRLIKQSH
ncbi:hypothetical protein N7497_007264 [Penicillium chrysogenum]|nr:hypothetical protein N7497_007264 [Penicillium chrysogenum]